jgi:hypothetical protein
MVMKGFKDTTRVQYFKGGAVTREKACGGAVKKAEGGRVTDPVKNKTGGKNDPEYGDYAISGAGAPANETKAVRKAQAAKTMRDTTGAAMLPAERRAMMKKAEGGKVDMKQDKKTVAAGAHKHERNMHPGKPLTKMQRGGFPAHNRAPMIKAR